MSFVSQRISYHRCRANSWCVSTSLGNLSGIRAPSSTDAAESESSLIQYSRASGLKKRFGILSLTIQLTLNREG